MLITKTVPVKIHSNNQKFYTDKGYDIPKTKHRYKTVVPRGTIINVKVADLQPAASYKIEYKCEECGKMVEVPYYSYVTNANNDLCQACAVKKALSVDLVGKTFGRLTVLEGVGKKVLCSCSCGSLVKVAADNLVRLHTQSCGCLDFEKKRERCGENSPMWKGGVTTQNMKERNALEYKVWRRSVFARDKYTCQKCRKVGGELNAHHVENFSMNPKLRLHLDNGVTLCKDCHKEFHAKHGAYVNRKQLDKFLETPIEFLREEAHIADILEKAGYTCEECKSASTNLLVHDEKCICDSCYSKITTNNQN